MGYFGSGILPALIGSGISGAVSGEGTLPAITGYGWMVSQGAGTLPALTSSGDAWSYTIKGEGILPALIGAGNALVGEISSGEGRIPLLESSGSALSGTLSSGEGILQALISSGWALPGTIGSGAGILIPITGTGNSLADTFGSGAMILPAIGGWGSARSIPITLIRRAIVMNVSTGAVTHYENFNFISVIQFSDDLLIGANEDGVYLLGGDDDLSQPIQAEITSGLHDLSEGAAKAAIEGWLAGRSLSNLDLTVRVDEQGDPYLYPFVRFGKPTEARAKIGKGLNKHRFFTFGVKNKGGSNFDIQLFRILGEIIGRKTR